MSSHHSAFRSILTHVKQGDRVLDLGCGNGDLLRALIQQKNVSGYGIEINFDSILSCIEKGIPVFQGNLDDGLSGIQDQSYDVVILSLTLQQVQKPFFLLTEMIRVGKKAIVMFPNFGYWKIRMQLLLTGQSPVTQSLPYRWHDTPNIRVITIHDFKELCQSEKIKIIEETPLFSNSLLSMAGPTFSNLFSEMGLFVISQ